MSKKTLLSWSTGKDCAWALHTLRQDPTTNVLGLFCTVNKIFNRVAMHGVRTELLQQQADSLGLPLHIIEIPYPCSNEEYAETMSMFVETAIKNEIECFAFGDTILEDVRQYREKHLSGSGITPIFPLWGNSTQELSQKMINAGLKAVITCIDPRHLAKSFVGREYNESFLSEIPENIDPCGENGEFHSFAFDGPMFKTPVAISKGEVVEREDFVFMDLLPHSSAM
ncbi:MAG: adenine nucleotide alpha hydrolase [Betaproteobacteria bacterium]|nr:adenine nucleotide alpha hydrolase [Betaproteobacteria bacterium]